MQVRDVLRVKGTVLYTTGSASPLGDAVKTMVELDMGSLVVMDHGHVAGMLTFREVFGALARRGADWQNVPVGSVMMRSPICGHPDMELDDLRRTMLDGRVRYLPVLDGDTLMGVLSFRDVAKAVLEEQTFENRMLKSYIRDWPAPEQL
ncbi:MAG: CBS domain-containing protein [Rhodocyclaceae bacterium]|nr:CBS domain-containing protein [Rhodocyclaceae bacterium]MBX3669739.1 CBS domain-containing protein [Rhodocyclaceae bacterium]